jgi:hypothetical protein
MGTAVVAEELPDADELDELYRLDASEPEPEDEDDDDGDDDGDGDGDGEDDSDGEDDDDDGEFKPGEMPHE